MRLVRKVYLNLESCRIRNLQISVSLMYRSLWSCRYPGLYASWGYYSGREQKRGPAAPPKYTALSLGSSHL